MKYIFTFFFCLVFFVEVKSQVNPGATWEWQQVFANDTDVVAKHVKVDNAGYVYLTGNFVDTLIVSNDTAVATGSTGSFLLKLDLSGNPLWMSQGGGGQIYITQNGEVFSGGFIFDPTTGDTTGTFDAGQVYCVSSTGDVITATWNEMDFMNPIVATVKKYLNNSGLEWQKSFTLDTWGSMGGLISEIRVHSNGKIFITGTGGDSLYISAGTITGVPTGGAQRFFVTSFSSTGDADWLQMQSDVSFALSEGYGMDLNETTGTLVTTGQLVGQMFLGTDSIGSQSSNSIFVTVFDLNGNLKRSAGFSSKNNVCCNSGVAVKLLNDGSMMLQAVFRDTLVMGTDTLIEDLSNAFNGMIADDIFITKLDTNWAISNTYYIGNVGNIFEGEFDIMPDGSFVFAGYDIIPGRTSALHRQGFVAKQEPANPVQVLRNDGRDLLIFPVPASDVLNINGTGPIGDYIIYNSMGSVVSRGIINGNTGAVDLTKLENGIYFLGTGKGSKTRFVIVR